MVSLVVGGEDVVGLVIELLCSLGGSGLTVEHAVGNVLELGVDLGNLPKYHPW